MANRYYKGPVSDHFDGQLFFQPGLPNSDKSLLDVLRWRVFGKRTPWPNGIPAKESVHPAPNRMHCGSLQSGMLRCSSKSVAATCCSILFGLSVQVRSLASVRVAAIRHRSLSQTCLLST